MASRDLDIQCLRKHLTEAQKHFDKAFEILERLEGEKGGGAITAAQTFPKETKQQKIEKYSAMLRTGVGVRKPIHLKNDAGKRRSA